MMKNRQQTKTTWQKVKFKDFAKLQRGFDLPKQNRTDGQYPVVASTSITAFHDKFKVKAPCITTGRSGALGEVLYTNVDCWPLNTTLWVKDFCGNNPKFIYYKLKTLGLEKFDAGAGVPTLNKNHLDSLDIDVPNLQTQIRIASVLSAYDDLIENNEKRIKALEEMAQLLYTEWFVKFKFPGHEKSKMVDSEFGKIPEGWEIKKLGDVLKLEYGNALTESSRKHGLVPVYGSGGQFAFHDTFLTKGPGIIVGRAGIPGAVYWSQGDFFCVDSTFYVESDISKYFLYPLLKRLNLKRFAAGAAVPGLNRNMAYSVKIVLPEIDLISKYTKKIKTIFEEVYKLKEQNITLSQIRDLLIPQLVTGKRELK